MPGLFTSLVTSANALSAYDRVLETISNNVDNASTPGFAKQRMTTNPLPFDPASGLCGGVVAGELESSRNGYAEQAVWSNEHGYGLSDQLASELSRIEPLFDVSGEAGIPGALNQFFQRVSSWSMAPNDVVARRAVIDQAGEVAQRFMETATGLGSASSAVNDRIRSTIATINSTASQIASLNAEMRSDFRNRSNAAIDAQLHNALETLAESVDFTALRADDGTVTILLGGQTPLVLGDQQYAISADTAGGSAALLDGNGKDITSQLSGGRLEALLQVRNSILPGLSDDLNRLAASFADSVNAVLAGGLDKAGNAGAPLFGYVSAADAAFTMHVTAITPDELAAAAVGAPGGSGNALELAKLAGSPAIDGMTFTQSYAQVASRAGQALDAARQNATLHQDLLVQSRSMRAELSGVSLDEEAAKLLQFQRAYQAVTRVVTTLNDLTQSTIEMLD